MDSRDYYWDEFDDFLIKWVNSESKKIIFTRQKVALKAWQIFLYCYDRQLAKTFPYDLLYSTVDLELSESHRYRNLKNILKRMDSNYSELYHAWRHCMGVNIFHYFYWLKDFVKQVGCS